MSFGKNVKCYSPKTLEIVDNLELLLTSLAIKGLNNKGFRRYLFKFLMTFRYS